jgi:uncharacterized membrane protein
LNYFESHDELYWNVTGNEWKIPVLTSSAAVELPGDVNGKDIRYKCFTGRYGSTEEKCSFSILESNKVKFESDSEFLPYEGLTIVLGWPKGVISQPSVLQRVIWVVQDNFFLFIPIFVFLFTFYYWWSKGRDPKMRETIIAEYEPPDGLSPAEVGAIANDHVRNKDITSELISLAIGGYLKIKQTGKGRKDYKLIKLKESADLRDDFDKKLMESLFERGNEVEMKDLENKFHVHIGTIKNGVYSSITQKKYYARNPQRARFGSLFVLGILTFFSSFILGAVFASFLLGFSLFVSAVIMIVFSFFMTKKTKKGVRTLEKILGFKDFLRVTEKERLKFHNPPDMVPDLFERFLPYAIVLGVENEWAENFAAIYKQQPDWYEGHEPTTWSAAALASSVSTFSSRSSAVMVSAPSSTAAGGGSGFSGGGAGGGGGGGGGGSW